MAGIGAHPPTRAVPGHFRDGGSGPFGRIVTSRRGAPIALHRRGGDEPCSPAASTTGRCEHRLAGDIASAPSVAPVMHRVRNKGTVDPLARVTLEDPAQGPRRLSDGELLGDPDRAVGGRRCSCIDPPDRRPSFAEDGSFRAARARRSRPSQAPFEARKRIANELPRFLEVQSPVLVDELVTIAHEPRSRDARVRSLGAA